MELIDKLNKLQKGDIYKVSSAHDRNIINKLCRAGAMVMGKYGNAIALEDLKIESLKSISNKYSRERQDRIARKFWSSVDIRGYEDFMPKVNAVFRLIDNTEIGDFVKVKDVYPVNKNGSAYYRDTMCDLIKIGVLVRRGDQYTKIKEIPKEITMRKHLKGIKIEPRKPNANKTRNINKNAKFSIADLQDLAKKAGLFDK